MPTVEERLAYLEGRFGEHATALTDVRGDIHELRGDIHELRAEVRTDIHALRGELHELRTDTNVQFTALRSGIDTRFAAVDARLAAMDGKFTWLIGIQVTMLLIFAGAALSMAFK